MRSFLSLAFFIPADAMSLVPGVNFFGFSRYLNRLSSSHVKSACLLAMLDENPVTEPKRPCKFGPTLLGSPAAVVWHEAQRALNNLAPASALLLQEFKENNGEKLEKLRGWVSSYVSCRILSHTRGEGN